MPINEDTVKDTKCILPWISLETTPLGKVRPCCLSTEELSGIDLTQDTLDDAFDSKTMRDLRRSFRRGLVKLKMTTVATMALSYSS